MEGVWDKVVVYSSIGSILSYYTKVCQSPNFLSSFMWISNFIKKFPFPVNSKNVVQIWIQFPGSNLGAWKFHFLGPIQAFWSELEPLAQIWRTVCIFWIRRLRTKKVKYPFNILWQRCTAPSWPPHHPRFL